METLVKSDRNIFPASRTFFDDLFTRDLFNWSNPKQLFGVDLPAVNIKEMVDTYEIEVVAPGMTKDDFNVELNNNKIVISAQYKESKEGQYILKEFSYKSFERSFNLPDRLVNGDKISAKYSDGILHITVPKTEQFREKPAKQILIS